MEYNLADLWEAVVDAVPDREALVCGERRLTYTAADERINRLAHALAGRGVQAGDHVGLYLYNGTEYLEGMLAAFKIRAVPVNVNYRYVAKLSCGTSSTTVTHRGDLPPRVRPEADGHPGAILPDLRVFAQRGGRL